MKKQRLTLFLAVFAACHISPGLVGAATSSTNTPGTGNARYILTPLPGKEPRINGAVLYGQRPGKPFLYTIAATGNRPMSFKAFHLPAGLEIDRTTGIITGSVSKAAEYDVTLIAENAFGSATRKLKIVIGNTLALTPPMGWNSWNCWNKTIDDEKVRANAEAMVKSGLINHGWSFINIDDAWQGERNASGAIQPNRKFPDMASLCDYIHGLGLKAGIYSSPWVKTFGNHIGSTSGTALGSIRDKKAGWYVGTNFHENADAKQWAEWGIDYLKYDWNPTDLTSAKRMRNALLACDRDIVFSVCSSAPIEEAQAWDDVCEAYFLWRTKGDVDIKDSWDSVASIGFRMGRWVQHSRPGHWNDPDMLVVGQVGWGPNLHPSSLTPDEQYTHISLWCLLSAPLLLGCDLTQLDDFTLSLLTNDEVLALDQDPLGKPAVQVVTDGHIQVWVKELADGNKAVGIFNLGSEPAKYSFNLSAIGYQSQVRGRDLWRQKNLGSFHKHFETDVPSHGVTLIKLFAAE